MQALREIEKDIEKAYKNLQERAEKDPVLKGQLDRLDAIGSSLERQEIAREKEKNKR